MAKRFLVTLLAAVIVMAMVVPGCEPADPVVDAYALTMAADPAVGGTAVDVTGDSPYAEGATVAILAQSAEGYAFDGWTAPAGAFGDAAAGATTFTMPAQDVTVTANFAELPEGEYAVTLLTDPLGAGITEVVTPGTSFPAGTDVTITAESFSGYYFVDWTGDVISSDQTHTFQMPEANVVITANFDEEDVPFFGAIDSFYKERGLGNTGFMPEVGARMANLHDWVNVQEMDHFWVTSGPFYLDSVDSTDRVVILKRFADYDISADKWLFLMDVAETGTGHMGAWVDEVVLTVEPSPASALTKMLAGDLDIYANTLADPAIFDDVVEEGLMYWNSAGNYMGFSFNPVPEVDGKFNPFSLDEVREGMNWAFDRTYIKDEVYGGLAMEKFTQLAGIGADANDRYPDLVAAIEAKYAYSLADAHANYAALLDAEADVYWTGEILNHTTGAWLYTADDTPVELTFYIRSEDEREQAGLYAAGQLEALGFAVNAIVAESGVCSPVVYGDPEVQEWHTYTEGWIGGAVPRDEGWAFGFLHTYIGAPWMGPLWEYYENVNSPEFYDASLALWNNDFADMDERRALFDLCLTAHLEESVRIYGVDNLSFTMGASDTNVAADGAGGVSASHQWANTVHFHDGDAANPGTPIVPTGTTTMNIALVNLLEDPWNPIAGSNWVFDAFPIRGLNDRGTYPDTRDGLYWPGRIQDAEVLVSEDLPPISHSTGLVPPHDWLALDTRAADHADLRAPDDAWYNWAPTLERFITVEEQMELDPEWSPYGRRFSRAYYPTGTFGIPMHDGSELSMADFLYGVILGMARGNPDSGALHDPGEISVLQGFLATHKGLRFITDEPGYDLIVETWTNSWSMDAEMMVSTWFPVYRQGTAPWHTLALGVMAERDGAAAFGEAKADFLGKEWMNWVDGPTLAVLKGYLADFI